MIIIGTSVTKVFTKFLGLIDDKEWLLVEDDIIESLMTDYLDSATTDFMQCRKDLTFTPPIIGEILVDGLAQEILFDPLGDGSVSEILSIVGSMSEQELVEDVDYTYTNGVITFITSLMEDLIIRYRVDGYFVSDLSGLEIRILSHAMLLHYLKPKIMTQESLKQYVSDKDFTKLSGANMLLRLMGLEKSQQKQLDILQGRYAFQEFEGWN